MVSIFASTLCSFMFRKNFKRKLPKNLNPEYTIIIYREIFSSFNMGSWVALLRHFKV